MTFSFAKNSFFGYEFHLRVIDGDLSSGDGRDWFELNLLETETGETIFESGLLEVQGNVVIHQKK